MFALLVRLDVGEGDVDGRGFARGAGTSGLGKGVSFWEMVRR